MILVAIVELSLIFDKLFAFIDILILYDPNKTYKENMIYGMSYTIWLIWYEVADYITACEPPYDLL